MERTPGTMLTQATRRSSTSMRAICSATASLGTVQSTTRAWVLTAASQRVRAELQIAIERRDRALGQCVVALGHIVTAGDEHGVVQLGRARARLLLADARLDRILQTEVLAVAERGTAAQRVH